ncbi:HAD family hydrolase [Thalassovita gelatinovora]|nr:HAD family hydrolase [Thalassovita gelatinovora]QIZ82478.1 HAD family hydrolase [Thalassovita gelatinovora]
MKIAGILFDKDGTLFDFRATWDVWAADLIAELAAGDNGVAQRIAEAIAFDLVSKQFLPHSPVIAGTNREAAECVGSALPLRSVEDLEIVLIDRAANAPLAPAVPLLAFMDGLAARGLALGVMTNDSEQAARAHLSHAGIERRLDFIAGFDSGFGAKPAPGPLLAFASQTGLAPESVVMVGDSTHDLLAGRRAGMRTLGVLTGVAQAEELLLLADAVLPDIGHIPTWLDGQAA